MKLYYSKGACSLAVRIISHEIGIPLNFEAVNLANKKTETGADFLKINPKGVVPVLVLDNQEILTENAAILQYLADKHQMKELLPAVDDFKRYRVLEWLNFIGTDLHKGFGPLFNTNIPEQLKDEIFKPTLKKKLNFVEQHLNNKEHLLGEQFTLADAYLFVILGWLRLFKMPLADWPNIQKYFEQLKKRESIQEALKEEKHA